QDAAIDWNPIWSPDGRSLYFLSDRNGTLNLWRIPIDETSGRPRGDPEPVTLPARAIMQFRLSRDGRKIIYMAREWAFHLQRFPLDAGRGVTAAAEEIWSGTMIVDDLAISRDGNWLAFGSPGKQEDIYLMRSDGSGLKKLTDDTWRDRHPTFSPDGQTIAFQSDRNGRWELWTIGVDGSALTQLTRTSGESPTDPIWSPDGAFIAFARGRDTQLVSMGGGRTAGHVESLPPPGPGLSFEARAWTPDNLQLLGVVRRDAEGTRPEGMTYTLSSRSYEKLPLGGTAMRFAPFRDGHHILVSSDERRGIALLDTRSGESRALLQSFAGRFTQTWAISPDEKFLFVNHATQEADIWLATLE
ncbi:MAG: hypothetical protein ACRD3M_04485, partial [Thermoanaerobaculia bacterium]